MPISAITHQSFQYTRLQACLWFHTENVPWWRWHVYEAHSLSTNELPTIIILYCLNGNQIFTMNNHVRILQLICCQLQMTKFEYSYTLRVSFWLFPKIPNLDRNAISSSSRPTAKPPYEGHPKPQYAGSPPLAYQYTPHSRKYRSATATCNYPSKMKIHHIPLIPKIFHLWIHPSEFHS